MNPRAERRPTLGVSIALIPVLAILALFMSGCGGEDVVIYCALDQNFSEPLIKEFEKQSGLKVRPVYDVEATKTVGLYQKIREEMDRPRCDVFWNNELMLTVRLKKLGALQPYRSPSAAEIPEAFKDPEGYWTGFAARARVLIVNTELVPDPAQRPGSYRDLIDPKWKGNCGMARPLTGTTATHGTILYQLLSEEEANAFFEGLLANEAFMLPGNAHLMKQVRKGEFAFGFTDTDDFNVARVDGFPVVSVYPDQGEGECGTLVIPNSVSMIKGAPHPEAAKKLIDYILSPAIEEKLAHATSAQIPLRADVKRPDHVKVPGVDFRVMIADFEQAAEEYEQRQEYFRETFLK